MTQNLRDELFNKLQSKSINSYFIKNLVSITYNHEQRPTDLLKDHNIYKLEISLNQSKEEKPNLVFEFRIYHNNFSEDAIQILNFYQIPYRDYAVYGNVDKVGSFHFVGKSETEKEYSLDEAINIIYNSWENSNDNNEVLKVYKNNYEEINEAILRLKSKVNQIKDIPTKSLNVNNFNFKIKEDFFRNFDEVTYKHWICLILYHYSLQENIDKQEFERLDDIPFRKLLNNVDPISRSIMYLNEFPINEFNELVFNKYYLRGRTRKSNYSRASLLIALYIVISNWEILDNDQKENINIFTNDLKLNKNFKQIINNAIDQQQIDDFSNRNTYEIIKLFINEYTKKHHDNWKKNQEDKKKNALPSFEPKDLLFIFSMAKKNNYIKDSINSKKYDLTQKGFDLLSI